MILGCCQKDHAMERQGVGRYVWREDGGICPEKVKM
jgi:hypothetical protein